MIDAFPLNWFEVELIFIRSIVNFPIKQVSYPTSEDKCRWFGRSLLEGVVLKQLRTLKLACSPSILTHKAPQRRCTVLVGALMSQQPPVDNKARLIERLKREPGFLKDALGMWVQKGSEREFNTLWTQLVSKLTVP